MTMWADNVKFVKDIVDSKYAKIETAAADVRENQKSKHFIFTNCVGILDWDMLGGNPGLDITFF